MRHIPQLRILMAVGQAALALALIGCDEKRPRAHYSVFSGMVVACHADTGELRVKLAAKHADDTPEETMYCVVTRDAEIYVNDRLSNINEIQLGDNVELIGRRDPESPIRRLAVNYAYIERASSPPPRPVLAQAPTTTQKAETSNQQRED